MGILLKDLGFFTLTGFHLLEDSVEAEEVGFPKLSVVFEPLIGFGERFGRETAGAALAVAAAGDEAGVFEDAKVFGNGGLAHREGFCQFEDARFSTGETSQDGATGGVGECGEDGVEAAGLIGLHYCITLRLYNHMVI
jgi:hypothetical protein